MHRIVIVDCPYCRTSNSESDSKSGPDGTIICRFCGRRFRAPDRAKEVGSNITQVARPKGPPPEYDIDDIEDHNRATVVVPVADLRESVDADEATNAHYSLDMDDGPTKVGRLVDENLSRTTPDLSASGKPNPNLSSTGLMSHSQLHEHLDAMTAPEASAPTKQFVKRPPVPEAQQVPTGRRQLRHWRDQFMQQPLALRLGVPGGAVFLVLLAGVGVQLVGRQRTQIGFATQTQPLLGEPMQAARPATSMGNLKKGQQITIFDDVGSYVMVRDLDGRVGYVQHDGLASERPASTPDVSFVDCKPAPSEADNRGCENRADEQWESCRTMCEKAAPTPKCSEDCRGLYRFCLAACHGEAVHPEPEPPAPPSRNEVPAAPEAPPHPEPAAAGQTSAPTAHPPESKSTPKSKTPPKKTDKKKKR